MNEAAKPKIDQTKTSRLGQFLILLPAVGILQFVVCCIIAANYYPGGSPISWQKMHSQVGYEFWNNPLSDLGRSTAWNGANNAASQRIYNPSLFFLGLSMIPFAIFMPSKLKGNIFLLKTGGFLILLSLSFLCGVASTPYDTQLFRHEIFLACWLATLSLGLLSFLISSGVFAFQQGLRSINVIAALASIIAVSFVTYHLLQTLFGWQRGLYIATQKVAVGSCMLWVVATALAMCLYPRRTQPVDDSSRLRPRKTILTTATATVLSLAAVFVIAQFTRQPELQPVLEISPQNSTHWRKSTLHRGIWLSQNEIVCWIHGRIWPQNHYRISTWLVSDGSARRLNDTNIEQIEICDPQNLPYAPIVLVETPADENEYDQWPETVVCAYHPPLPFKNRFKTTVARPLDQNGFQIIAVQGTGLVIPSDITSGMSVDSFAQRYDGDFLIVTLSRHTSQ